MDKRISELRERLYKKKAEARQKENLPVRLEVLNTYHELFSVEMLVTKVLVYLNSQIKSSLFSVKLTLNYFV